MKPTLRPGANRTETITVDEDKTLGFLGEALRVYSTPAMVHDIEYNCHRLVQEHLDEGESSVGIHISVDHMAATPLGHAVEVTAKIVAVDGKKLELEAEVRDALEVVGKGRHLRVVIDVERQGARILEKKAKLE